MAVRRILRRTFFLLILVTFASVTAQAATATALVPTSAPRLARVIVTGSGLNTSDVTATFATSGGGTTSATVVSRTATLLELIVPLNAATGSVRVNSSAGVIGTFSFTLTADAAFTRVGTLAGHPNPGATDSNPGVGTFGFPTGIAVTPDGSVFVADSAYQKIFKVTAAGSVTTFAGSGQPGAVDGPPGTARFNFPTGLAYDATRQLLYVADTANHKIRKIAADGTVSLHAGSGTAGSTNGTGAAARFDQPTGLTLDASGNLYVADTDNHKIRKVTPAGVVTTFAGSGTKGYSNGTATAAKFDTPVGIEVSASGAVYVADMENKAIRKIDSNAVTTVLRDTSVLNQVLGLALSDDNATLYITTFGTDRVLRINLAANPAAAVLFAGSNQGYVDGTLTSAKFRDPTGIAISGGTIYVSDTRNNAVRNIQGAPVLRDLYPRSGPAAGGTAVRIFGTGFGVGTQLKFGSTTSSSVTVADTTELLATTPAGTGTVNVTVTTPAGTATLTNKYTYLAAPVITGFTPASGPTGTVVTITGQNFDPDPAGNVLKLGTQIVPITSVSATQIVFTVPAGAASGVLSVTTAGGTGQSAASFIVGSPTDTIPPTITYTISPTPNADGWTNANTTVTFTCADAGSGIATCTSPVTITAETAGQDVVGSAVDRAGNTATVTARVKLDKSNPAIEALFPPPSLTKVLGKTGTTVDTVIVSRITDVLSGPKSVTCNGVTTVPDGNVYRCATTLQPGANNMVIVANDAAGNSAQFTRQIQFVVDDTPPTIAAGALPPANAAGWRHGPKQVTFTCADDQGETLCSDSQYLDDGADQTVTGVATDVAGNKTSLTLTLNIDTRTPTLEITSPLDVLTKDSVFHVAGTVTDETSGIKDVRCGGVMATLTGDTFDCAVTLAAGSQTIAVVATDNADTTQTQTVAVKLDQIPPDITISEPVTGLTTHAPSVLVSGRVSDGSDVQSLSVGGIAVPLNGGSTFAVNVPLLAGANHIEVSAVDTPGNVATKAVDVQYVPRGTVLITSPADLAVLRSDGVTVTGTYSGPLASIRVNGIDAALSGTSFTVPNVPLLQGRTVITAIGLTAGGQVSTSSVHVYRDSITPRVVVYDPPDGSEVNTPTTIVAGMVDDIVVGTINAGQMHVTVNGQPAIVSNRMFKASNVSLAAGANTLIVTATDQGGNLTTISHTVHYVPATTTHLVVVSGNDQTATIGAALNAPLRIRLVDGAGQPVASKNVNFAVTQNNGGLVSGVTHGRHVTAVTDAQGEASVQWTLGTRAGAGNQRVDVTSSGAVPAHFLASANAGAPALIVVDMGNNQFGVVNERLQRPLVVDVVDLGSNRLADVPVTFFVVDGNGSFDGNASVVVHTDTDGRAWVTPTLGAQEGFSNNLFSAALAGVAGTVTFQASAAEAGPAAATRISGVVLDNSSQPITGVTLRIEGTPIQTQSDAQGQFVFNGAPIGYVRLIVDGSTAQRPGTWPMLEFAMFTCSGQNNTVGMPIYLLPIDVTRGIQVDETHGGTITLPELPGFALSVAPGAALFPGGSRTGNISVTLVHNDHMPMEPGFGQQPRFLLTIQPPGVHFDPPAALTLPNVDGLAPGEVTELYSFDHDLGQFVAIGTGSVSEDGTTVRSDAGVGIIKGGWHCGGNPQGSGDTSTDPEVSLAIDTTAPPAPPDPGSPLRFAVSALGGRARTNEITAPAAALINTCVKVVATGKPVKGSGDYEFTFPGSTATIVGPQPSCSGKNKCERIVKATEPGEVKVHVKFTADGKSADDEKSITFSKLTLTELEFINNIQHIRKDKVGANPDNIPEIPAVVWKSTNTPEQNEPVAYIGSFRGNKKMKVKATYKVEPPPAAKITDVVFEAEVSSDDGFPGGKLKKKRDIDAGAATVVIEDFDVPFNLPKTTQFFDPMKIKWTVRPSSPICPAPVPAATEAGKSDIPMYITLEQHHAPDLFLTAIHLGVKGPRSATLEEAVANIWGNFGTGSAPKNIEGWDERKLVYYPAGTPFGSSEVEAVKRFLVNGNGDPTSPGSASAGRCGMQADLLTLAYDANGIYAATLAVAPLLSKKDTLCRDTHPTDDVCADGILVKNWSIANTPPTLAAASATANYKYLFQTTAPKEMWPPPGGATNAVGAVYGDLKNEPGAAGQNSPTPSEKRFPNHALVSVGKFNDNNPVAPTPVFTKSYTFSSATKTADETFTVPPTAGQPIIVVFETGVSGAPASAVKISVNGTEVYSKTGITAVFGDGRAIPLSLPPSSSTLKIELTATTMPPPAGGGPVPDTVAKVTLVPIVEGRFFDPSYGREYGSLKQFETDSLAFYLRFMPGMPFTLSAARVPAADTGIQREQR